jgi:hypothetical protein
MKTIIFSIVSLLMFLATGCAKSSDKSTTAVSNCTWSTIFSDNFQRSDTAVGSNFQVIITPTPYGGHGFADIYNSSLRISSDSVYWAIVYAQDVDASKTMVSVECTTPTSGGTCAFGVGGKFTAAGTMTQSGYFAAAMNNGIGIFKISNGVMKTLASQTYTVQYNHTYKIALTIDGEGLTATITDQGSGTGVIVTATDSGTLLSGKQYSINGNSLGGQVVLLLDNFMIEACQ